MCECRELCDTCKLIKKEKKRNYMLLNKEKYYEANKRWRDKQVELGIKRIPKYYPEYYENNKDKINAKNRAYSKKRYTLKKEQTIFLNILI